MQWHLFPIRNSGLGDLEDFGQRLLRAEICNGLFFRHGRNFMAVTISLSRGNARAHMKKPENTTMNIGNRVKARRKELGLTQVDLARISGITQSSLSNIETGETKSLRGMTLIGLARALRTTTRWIMTGKGPHEPEPQLSAQEEHLLELFIDLSDANRQAALAMVEALKNAQPPESD